MTQMELARKGLISSQMKQVASQEKVEADIIRLGVAEGVIVIPANINHRNLTPFGIGRGLSTKVNANIGTSSDFGTIETELEKHQIDYVKLTGQTRKRDEVITQFQEGDIPVFLISLKAGGVGLNLTAADTVIHYDPWWNPAAEDQATDRAHRIGQDKAVFVYKLISEDTVEDKILGMQKSKKELAESIYSGKGQEKGPGITSDELTTLLKPMS
jgi:hypothetical protein